MQGLDFAVLNRTEELNNLANVIAELLGSVNSKQAAKYPAIVRARYHSFTANIIYNLAQLEFQSVIVSFDIQTYSKSSKSKNVYAGETPSRQATQADIDTF